MKRSTLVFLAFIGLLTFSSCTPVLYKHQQILASCRTRDDVSHRIGLPDEKIHAKTTEQWVYNLDSHHDYAVVTPLQVDSSDTGKVINYGKYLRFIFDLQGNVTGIKAMLLIL